MTREEWRQEQRERARLAQEPVSAAAFQRWAFGTEPELCEPAIAALQSAEPKPTPAFLLREVEGVEGAQTRRQHTQDADWSPLPQGLAGTVAWLDWLGAEVEERERRTWDHAFEDTPDDAAHAAIWAALVHGDPWARRQDCEDTWLPTVERVFAGVLASRDLPLGVRRRVIDDLREAFFVRLLGPEFPGWRDLAVRVFETLGPLQGPAEVLSPDGRGAAGQCVAHRGRWATTLERLVARPDRQGRGRVAAEWMQDTARVEALLDLHVVLRLISVGPTDLATAWRLVTQNRGKARGRLRALLVRQDLSAVVGLEGLAARTDAALARWAWAWAWQELAVDFSFDGDRPLTPVCEGVVDALPPLTDDDAEALATWVLLVVLKGRLSHLRRWAQLGGTGDRDSTWARLQSELPVSMLDPDGRYRRVRMHLADTLETVLQDHAATLVGISALPASRGLKQAVLAILSPSWHPVIRVPRSGFPTFRDHASSALGTLK